MQHKVSNADLRLEIYRSKLSYTDLPRKAQRSLPFPDLFVDSFDAIPAGFTGLAKVYTDAYLPKGFETPDNGRFRPYQLVQDGRVIASAFLDSNGCTSVHGRLTDRLGTLIYTLVTNYARKPNWSGYSYLDEMVAFALAEAMVPVLRCDESPRANPFAFITQNTFYAFVKVQRREAAVAKVRFAAVEAALDSCAWSAWKSDDAEADNNSVAIYDAICAEMDLLFRSELERRDAKAPLPTRKPKYSGLKVTPVFAQAIKYGLGAGLTGAAIAQHFGLDQATVTRVKNDVDRRRVI